MKSSERNGLYEVVLDGDFAIIPRLGVLVNPFFEIFSDFFWNPQNARIMGVLGLFLGVEGGFSAKNARATNYFTQLESLAQSAASLSPGAKRTI